MSFKVLLFAFAIFTLITGFSILLGQYSQIEELETSPKGSLIPNKIRPLKDRYKIPEMEPFHPSLVHCVKKPELFECDHKKPPLVDSNSTSLFLLEGSIPHYAINKSLECCYAPFSRRKNQSSAKNRVTPQFGQCKGFNKSVLVQDEFVIVTCHSLGEVVYKDAFAFIPLKSKNPRNPESFNILVLGMSRVSNMNFRRQMPRTYSFLNHIKANEFVGFNTIADTTNNNILAAFTGIGELPQRFDPFEGVDFIWKTFEDDGYTTSYSEDCAKNSLFNLGMKGLELQSTHYFKNFFNEYTERMFGNKREKNKYKCIRGRRIYEEHITYAKAFLKAMETYQRKFFAVFWTRQFEDHLNEVGMADGIYAFFLERLYFQNALNKTILVIMSDYGMNSGCISETSQGKTEWKLPVLMIRLPEWFERKYPAAYENFVGNQNSLVTAYDLHGCLKDLARPQGLFEFNIQNATKLRYSLFDNIPSNRTCRDANIPDECCSCL